MGRLESIFSALCLGCPHHHRAAVQEGGPGHGAAVPALGPERSGQGTEEGHVPHLGVPVVRRGGLPHAHAQPRAAGPAVGRHVRGGGQTGVSVNYRN